MPTQVRVRGLVVERGSAASINTPELAECWRRDRTGKASLNHLLGTLGPGGSQWLLQCAREAGAAADGLRVMVRHLLGETMQWAVFWSMTSKNHLKPSESLETMT